MPESPGPAFKLDLQALSNAVSAEPEPEPEPISGSSDGGTAKQLDAEGTPPRPVVPSPHRSTHQLPAAGNEFVKQSQFLKAAGSFKKAAREDPLNPRYHLELAAALNQLLKYDQAIKAAKACIELEPRNEAARLHLAHAFVGAGRLDVRPPTSSLRALWSKLAV